MKNTSKGGAVRVTTRSIYMGVIALLLLTVMWVLPASAAPALQAQGVVSTDIAFVSPTLDLDGDGDTDLSDGVLRAVTVTVVDTDLSTTEYVGAGPAAETKNFDAVVITMPAAGVNAFDTLVLDVSNGTFAGDANLLTQADIDGGNGALVLPMIDRNGSGSVTLADLQLQDAAGAATTDLVITALGSATSGTVLMTANVAIAAGTEFLINYATSPQETTVVTVTGDAGSFELALRESSDPNKSGTYTGSFFAAESVDLNANATTDEQHAVPGGLTANAAITNEAVAIPALNTAAGACCALGESFQVTLDNFPLKDGSDTDTDVTVADVSADGTGIQAAPTAIVAATGVVTFLATGALTPADTFDVDYNAPEDFSITLTNAPTIGGAITVAGNVAIPTSPIDAAADLYVLYETSEITGVSRFGALKATPAQGTFITVTYVGSDEITLTSGLDPDCAGGAVDADDADCDTIDATDTVTLALENQLTSDAVVADVGLSDLSGVAGLTAGLATGGFAAATSINLSDNTVTLTVAAGQELEAGDVIGFSYPYAGNYNTINASDPVLVVDTGNAATSRPTIVVGDGGSISISYNDADPVRTTTTRVDAEGGAPTSGGVLPANDAATAAAVTFSIDLTDDLAGVDTDSILFVMYDDSGPAVAATTTYASLVGANVLARTYGDGADETITFTTVGDTVTASALLADIDEELGDFAVPDSATTTVSWWVTFADSASNADVTDADADTAGDQPYRLRVDSVGPTLSGAFTGDNWDATDEQIEGDRRLGVGSFLPGASDSSTIRVEYNENLDVASAAAEDYTVTGYTVTAANQYALSPTNVYLTVSPALTANAIPSVNQTGVVLDEAGNALTNPAAVTPADGIAPNPTVTVSAATSTKAVTVTVETDETPRVRPTVTVLRRDATVAPAPTISRPTTTTHTYAYSITNAGEYSVQVSVEDANRNRSNAGNSDPDGTGAILFEIDNALPAADSTTPAAAADVSESDPFFIEIVWESEGSEYDGDGQTAVTLTKAELDDVDVLGLHSTRDDRNFTIAILVGDFLALSGDADFLGEHTLEFNAEDGLGNTLATDASLTFTVSARPLYAIGIAPGLNLIGLPSDPNDGDINTVFGGTAAIEQVFTFDNEAGHFLVAIRDSETGNFVGTLDTVDAKHAYWIKAGATASLEIDIPGQSAQGGLPFISVHGGQWNLVPVISLEALGDITQGTEIDADDYLGSFRTAFTYETGQWVKISAGVAPDNNSATLTDSVQEGRGYWVFYDTTSTLTP
jgi:hypothetical protein